MAVKLLRSGISWVIDEAEHLVPVDDDGNPITNHIEAAGVDVDGSETVLDDSEHTSQGKGPVVKSPDGTRWRLKVADDGTVSAEVVT